MGINPIGSSQIRTLVTLLMKQDNNKQMIVEKTVFLCPVSSQSFGFPSNPKASRIYLFRGLSHVLVE